LSDLRARKELILAEADLRRQLLTLERLRWQRRGAQAQELIADNRWWLIGAAAVVGAVVVRRWRGLADWLPGIVATARAMLR
jgi:hypothetical protein